MSNPLDQLLRLPEVLPHSYRWGTMVSPTALVLDGETLPLDGRPSFLANVEVGDRVFVLIYGHRIVVLGRAGGELIPDPPQWQNWTPTFESTASPGPTWGASTRTGRYIQQADGTVHFAGTIVIGSGFDSGAGLYEIPLPVPARPGIEWPVQGYVVSTAVLGGSGEGIMHGKVEDPGTHISRSYIKRLNHDSTLTLGSSLSWEVGNKISVSGTYEAAS